MIDGNYYKLSNRLQVYANIGEYFGENGMVTSILPGLTDDIFITFFKKLEHR
jgi:hypothetical protein